jgi:hypothetical protein
VSGPRRVRAASGHGSPLGWVSPRLCDSPVGAQPLAASRTRAGGAPAALRPWLTSHSAGTSTTRTAPGVSFAASNACLAVRPSSVCS